MYHGVHFNGPLGRWVKTMAAGLDSHDHLADGLRRGNPEAVAGLVETFGAGLYSYLSLMLGDRDVATHALADTLIVATAHITRLSEIDHIQAWLFALARCERERRQQAALARAIPDTLGAMTTRGRAQHHGASPAELWYLAATRLDPREREALLLGATLAVTDIARVLGTEEPATAELRRRALRRFREQAELVGLDPDIRIAEAIGSVPRDRLIYMCVAPEMAGRRPQVQERAGPFGPDGFPLAAPEMPGAADGHRHRRSARLRLRIRSRQLA
jgi:DNA-directed RNA polymerase specialized sigma24 family protein